MKTIELQDWLDRVAKLGCLICGAPACLHHIKTQASRGMGKKRLKYEAIPLCYEHHQGNDGIHSGEKTWEAKYGNQADMMNYVLKKLGAKFIYKKDKLGYDVAVGVLYGYEKTKIGWETYNEELHY